MRASELTCTVEGCDNYRHAKGLCGMHYQRMKKGADVFAAGPRPVDSKGWAPPADLSPAWKDAARPRAPRAVPERSCALDACAGTAVPGSPYCAAHKHYREAQERLKVRAR